MTTQRRYHNYALLQGNLISINDVKGRKLEYTCPHCHQPVIPRMGEKNEWHFAHKGRPCKYDNYIHTLAKIRIRDWFNSSKEFKIQFDMSDLKQCPKYDKCEIKHKPGYCSDSSFNVVHKAFDLKKNYGSAQLEKSYTKDGKTFVADILCPCLKNGLDPLFIEIYVTHPVTEDKKNSGLKIIELRIKTEQDIDDFINGEIPLLKESHIAPIYYYWEKCVKFYGFNPKPRIIPERKNWIIKRFNLYADMNWKIKTLNCESYVKDKDSLLEILYYEGQYYNKVPANIIVARAIEKGYSPKGYNYGERTIKYMIEQYHKYEIYGNIIEETSND